MHQKSLFTSKEAAEYIGYSEYSLRATRTCSNRTLGGVTPPPHIKIGRNVRYKIKDLDLWVESLGESK